jgi:glycosyltransferase involved in cell wall biosynthesis
MSTGAIPIVTDIPSFRLLCDGGRAGYLFPPGEVEALQNILFRLPATATPDARAQVLRRFEQEFSYPAIAQKFLTLYQE